MKHLPGPFLLLLFILSTPGAFGQVRQFAIHQLGNTYPLNDYLDILALDKDTLTLANLQEPVWARGFVPFGVFLAENYPGAKHPVNLDAGKTYWCRIFIQNNLPENTPLKDWNLFTGKSNRTEVWLVHPGGSVEGPKRTGLIVPAQSKDFLFGNQEHERVKISLPPAGEVTIFIKITAPNLRSPWIDVQLTSEDFFHSWGFVQKTRKNWAFIGFLLTFILLNLILYFGTKDRAFLYHSLFQMGIFIYLLEFFSMLYDLVLLRDHPYLVQAVIYLSLAGMDLAYLQFIRAYMDMKRHFPGSDAFFKKLIITRAVLAVGVIALFYWTNNMPLADNITAVYMILQYAGVGFVMLVFMKKDLKTLFLVAGTFMFILGVALNGWSVITGRGLHFGYTQVGVIGEVFLFSLGLGYRMKLLIEEQHTTQRLRDMDDFKTKFFANISHEFRTPLTVIQGMTNQLRTGSIGPEQQKKLDLITSNSDHLLRLVNRMLALAKLQSGKTELNLRRGDVIEFLRYLTFSFQPYALGKDIQIRFLTSLETYEMDFDAEKVQDVMTNLLSNAIKFTQRGGRVTVLVKTDGDEETHLMIQVKDTGIGMSRTDFEHIFERFYQGNAAKQTGQGSGLGLAITRELVRVMQGTIEVESEGGVGSTFTVVLPVSRSAPALAGNPAAPVQMDDLQRAEHVFDEKTNFTDEKPIALVVDDNYDVLQFIKSLLEKDYQIALATDGTSGIERAFEIIPDVVISDVIMPGADGTELCRTLKADERTSHIPVILLTAKAGDEDRLAGLESGADAYLTKPFREEELFLLLRNFVRHWQQMQAYFKKRSEENIHPDAAFQTEDAFLSKVRKIIEANIEDEDFGVVQLCRKLGMSRSQLHRKIVALTGDSTSHLINDIRLGMAKQLLASTQLNVSEIAYRTGLEPNYFSRIFKENTGLTPSGFREKGQ